MTKNKLVFTGYFLVFPAIFIISSLVWRLLIRHEVLLVSLADTLSILAIYYFIASAFFVIRMK